MCLEERGSWEHFVGSLKLARELPNALGNLVLPRAVSTRISECMQIVVAQFATSLQLHSISVAPWDKCPGDLDIAGWLATFADRTSLAEAVKFASKFFAATCAKEHEWPSAATYHLMLSLMEAIPDDAFSVDLQLPQTDCRKRAFDHEIEA